MGCSPLKKSRPLLDVPDFTITKKGYSKEDELNHLDDFFAEYESDYVRLSLESNTFRSKRLSLSEIKF